MTFVLIRDILSNEKGISTSGDELLLTSVKLSEVDIPSLNPFSESVLSLRFC